jgi:hypothetical protein
MGDERESISNRTNICIFAVLLMAFCIWVLQLPMFPMQDGPMHLYLARVLGDLLRDPHSFYAQFYTVQHWLPPYSLHYYILIGLMKFVPSSLAEKIVICIILICFCCGIRSLATASGKEGRTFSLFAFAIALNWPLMMGFQNYVLSLAFASFALGVWIRNTQRDRIATRALFVGLCALIAITHPLPLLLVLGFAASDLAIRVISSMQPRWMKDAISLLVAATLLLYFRAFTDTRRSAQDLHPSESALKRVHYFVGLHGLDFFARTGLASRYLQAALYLIVLLCIGFSIAAYMKRRKGVWKPAYTWLFVTVLFTLALPFLPDDLSGSKALVSRLQIVTWIGFLASASAIPRLSRRWTIALILLAVSAAGVSLGLGQVRLAPIARRIAYINQHPLSNAGNAGLLLSAAEDDVGNFDAVTYEPLHWQAANYFSKTGAAILNTPWMDSTWLPLAAKPTLLTGSFTPWTMECYHCLRQQLVDSASVRATVLPRTDFIAFVDQPGTATQATLDEVLKADPSYHWSCEQQDWLWICRKLP